ncbi:tetratricopeptide repeat protein [Sphingorhabdus profundilacus]|nr:tetratricopeptide repeat protein [Sphingorhabdus profundilacus]
MIFRIFLMGSAALMLSVPVHAQDANIDGRVGKLEKEMRAVQRQVFPNGAGKFLEPEIQTPNAPKPTGSASTATADLLARVDTLETQLATLTGQIEQHENVMRSMESRLKTLEAQLKAQSEATTVEVTEPPAAAAIIVPAPKPTPAAVTVQTKPKVAAVVPAAKPSAARTAAVAAVEKPATGDVFEDGYTYGYRLWEAKFYPEAQVMLEEIIKKNPKHKRASYARNLLGRAWLDDKKPATAVKVFYENYKNEPRGDRAADSLFYLGSALTDLGKAAEACEAFGELAKAYPDVASGRLAERMTAGKIRAKCT